jgi:hypothetical protein
MALMELWHLQALQLQVSFVLVHLISLEVHFNGEVIYYQLLSSDHKSCLKSSCQLRLFQVQQSFHLHKMASCLFILFHLYIYL